MEYVFRPVGSIEREKKMLLINFLSSFHVLSPSFLGPVSVSRQLSVSPDYVTFDLCENSGEGNLPLLTYIGA